MPRIELTHGARRGSDWSVDRLNNDGAYAPNNLAVMSTLANQAKGSRCFEHVYALSQRGQPTDGPAPVEWLRLAALTLGPCRCSASTSRSRSRSGPMCSRASCRRRAPIVQTREIEPSPAGKRSAMAFATFDIVAALGVAFFINAAILITSAAVCHTSGHHEVADLEDAHALLGPLTGVATAVRDRARSSCSMACRSYWALMG